MRDDGERTVTTEGTYGTVAASFEVQQQSATSQAFPCESKPSSTAVLKKGG